MAESGCQPFGPFCWLPLQIHRLCRWLFTFQLPGLSHRLQTVRFERVGRGMMVPGWQPRIPALRKHDQGQSLWARGSFCATVEAVDEKMIKRSIAEQKWDDDGEGQFRTVGGK